jgi:hypothetical protein
LLFPQHPHFITRAWREFLLPVSFPRQLFKQTQKPTQKKNEIYLLFSQLLFCELFEDEQWKGKINF